MDLYCLCEAFASTEAAKFLPLSFKAASDHFCLPPEYPYPNKLRPKIKEPDMFIYSPLWLLNTSGPERRLKKWLLEQEIFT